MRVRGSGFPNNGGEGVEYGERNVRRRRWYKPLTVVIDNPNGEKLISKTYPSFFFPLTQYFRALARHECRMLQRVEALRFTPDQVGCSEEDSRRIVYRYIEGTPLKEMYRSGRIPEDFFVKLYASVQQLHRSGVVHLDLGNSGNVLCSPSGEPVIIDFGSALALYLLPRSVGSWACKKDLLGVLKLWYRFDRGSMPLSKQDYFRRHYRKNLCTPRRLLKALKHHSVSSEPVFQWQESRIPVIGLLFCLLALLSFIF